MRTFGRYAIYFLPARGWLHDFGSQWLGWDVIDGVSRDHPVVPDLPISVADMTETPRKYGFHGTIKPPFRLRFGTDPDDLFERFEETCKRLPSVLLQGLEIAPLGSFLALRPVGDQSRLADVAATMVTQLDPFRAPPSEAELQRRKSVGLSLRQTELLEQWGYPYLMDEFKFHMTLTGRLSPSQIEAVLPWLKQEMSAGLNGPFQIGSLCLCGEDQGGKFHLIHRETLSGESAESTFETVSAS